MGRPALEGWPVTESSSSLFSRRLSPCRLLWQCTAGTYWPAAHPKALMALLILGESEDATLGEEAGCWLCGSL